MGGTGTGTPATSTLKGKVRIELLDNSLPYLFADTEIDQAINETLAELSRKCPNLTVETLHTVANSRDIAYNSLTNLASDYLHSIEWVEYPVGQYPEKYRNFELSPTSLRIKIDSAPTAGDDEVHVGCRMKWTTETLPDMYYDIVAGLATAKAAINKPLATLNSLCAEDRWANITATLGDAGLTGRITQAISDLSDGREILSGSESSDITARLEKAVADIQSARNYFNALNVADPENEYLRSANAELSSALGYFRQFEGYTGSEALGQLKVAASYLAKAQGYLGLFNAKATFSKIATYYETWGQRKMTMALLQIRGIQIPFDQFARGNRVTHPTD